jgi:hypothetical protein
MVRPERFELPACCFGGNRSIQLSYGRTMLTFIGYHFRPPKPKFLAGAFSRELTRMPRMEIHY